MLLPFLPQPPLSGINGDLTITFDPMTSALTGALDSAGDLSVTFGDMTMGGVSVLGAVTSVIAEFRGRYTPIIDLKGQQ